MSLWNVIDHFLADVFPLKWLGVSGGRTIFLQSSPLAPWTTCSSRVLAASWTSLELWCTKESCLLVLGSLQAWLELLSPTGSSWWGRRWIPALRLPTSTLQRSWVPSLGRFTWTWTATSGTKKGCEVMINKEGEEGTGGWCHGGGHSWESWGEEFGNYWSAPSEFRCIDTPSIWIKATPRFITHYFTGCITESTIYMVGFKSPGFRDWCWCRK